MTIASSTNKHLYAGTGAQTVFPYTFRIWRAEDMRVVLRDADESETVLSLGTDYAVSGAGSDDGGNVTLLGARAAHPPAAGEYLLVKRVLDPVQDTDLVENAATPAAVMEGTFDRLTAYVQQLSERMDRAVVMGETVKEDEVLDAKDFLNEVNKSRDNAFFSADGAAQSASESQMAAANAGIKAQQAADAATTATTKAAEAAAKAASATARANDAFFAANGAAQSASESQVAAVSAGIKAQQATDAATTATTKANTATEKAEVASAMATAAANSATAAQMYAQNAGVMPAMRDTLGVFPGIIRPTLNLHAGLATSDDCPLGTFSRSSVKWRLGPTGLLESVAADKVAREWDASGNLLGWLIEEQRTNYVSKTVADFSTTGVTKTTGQASPDGGTSAVLLTNNEEPISLIGDSFPIGAGSTTNDYYITWYVKRGTSRYVTLNTFYVGEVESNGVFDFDTLTATAIPYSGEYIFQKYGNDWYRIGYRISRSTTGAATAIYARLWIGARGSGSIGDTVYAFLPQLERGAFPTSPIVTTNAAITRPADVWTIPTSAFPFNALEGTLYVDADYLGINAYPGLIGLCGDSESWDDSMYINLNSYGQNPRFSSMVGGVLQVGELGQTYSSVASGTCTKSCAAFKANDFAFCRDGLTAVVDTSGLLPTITRVLVGRRPGGETLCGHIKHLSYFHRRLANANLQAITL